MLLAKILVGVVVVGSLFGIYKYTTKEDTPQGEVESQQAGTSDPKETIQKEEAQTTSFFGFANPGVQEQQPEEQQKVGSVSN